MIVLEDQRNDPLQHLLGELFEHWKGEDLQDDPFMILIKVFISSIEIKTSSNNRMKSKIKLSSNLFLKFLADNHCAVSTVYCIKTSDKIPQVCFVECRTPKQQKTFLVRVPEKYILNWKGETKVVYIKKDSEDLQGRQLQYLSSIRGPLLECDLIAISSTSLCWYRNSDESSNYELVDGEESDSEEPEEDDVITDLEKGASKVLEKVGGSKIPVKEDPDSKDPEDPEDPEDSEDPEDPKGDSEPDSEAKVELVFQDEEGEPIDDIKEFIEPDEEAISKGLTKAKEQTTSEVEKSTSLPNLVYSDIVLGIVYPAIDMGSFYRKAKQPTFEKEIVSFCEQIDKNILQMRQTKLQEIRDLTSSFLTRASSRLKEIEEQEKQIKTALLRLTVLHCQVQVMKNKVETNPKLQDERSGIEDLDKRIRQTISDLNIDLLRQQDAAEELLLNYHSSISELMEL